MLNKQITKLSQTLLSGLLTAGILMSANTAQAAVSQAPLNLVEGVAPNILFTLDESGSMSWSHVPDYDTDAYNNLIGDKGSRITDAKSNTRRYRASNTNPMYYNPNIIYNVPPAFEESGEEKLLATDFYNAPINGFKPDDYVDLSKEYKVVLEHRIPVGTLRYSEHPSFDFSCSISGFNKNETRTCYTDNEKVKFNITRTSYRQWGRTRIECNATASLNSVNYAANCSFNSIGNVATASVDTGSGVPAYYYEFDERIPGCIGQKNTKYAGGEKCYSLKFVTKDSAYNEKWQPLKYPNGEPVDGRVNFAIWYSFYKTRALATLSAASIAFYDLSSNVRFSWQDLATCRSFDGSDERHCKKNRLQAYTSQHRGQFYSWLRDVYFNVGTPLPAAMIRAGEFYKTDMPWRMFPQDPSVGKSNTRNTKENTLACRPSYHVMMTDGMWNTRQTYTHTKSSSGSWKGSYDDKEVAYPSTNTDDNMPAPYGDSTRKTLADIAMHYWKTDLFPLLDNKVPAYMPYRNAGDDDPRNNPATHQHMSNFIMGLGLTNALNDPNIPWEGQTHTGKGYAALKSGDAQWPAAGLQTSRGWGGNVTETNGTALEANVYDLWHAAINSRGEFYSVESPEDMVKAFKDIMNRIAERQSSAALPAISTSVESDETDPDSIAKLASYFYRSSFDSTDWSGDLEKIKSYVTYTSGVRSEVTESVWKASNKLPKPGGRKIYIAGTGSNKLQPFTTTNISSVIELKNVLNKEPDKGITDNNWEKRLNFIRGDKSNEGSLFRERETVIGEFLNSRPVLVSGARYLEGFANKIEGENHTKYSSFVDTQKKRRAQVYIGGNDGMLHAFDAASGEEKFAFIPTAVFPNLNRLTDPKYSESHHFYVDGTPEVADVYDGTNWRTILVGTLRAGGKGIFALDVTDPDSIKLLWELDENSAEFKNKVKPGYSFPKPTIARLHNGRWAVVTGNGIENGDDSGKAALYIIDAITGKLTKSLEVESDKAINNGLSTPKLVDFDADGIADYAYAGDMHGNLWRFDLLGNSASQTRENGSIYGDRDDGVDKFRVSYGGKDGKPMFTAVSSEGRPQMITAPPSIVRHPDRASYLVVFGTGKYYEEGDKGGDLSSAQTLYAIWDEKTMAQSTESALSISRSNLVGQSFIEEVVGENAVAGVTRQGRTLTNNLVSWEDNKGWFLDLKVGSKLTGEMLIDDMLVVGRTLLFSTLVPNDDPCAHGAGNWLYAINPFTGGRTERHVFDTRGPNAMVLSGIKFGDPGGVPLTLTSGGLEVPSSSGYEGINIAEMTGRQTWRVVPDP